jgi:choline-glycine betaine transporter
LDHDSLSTTVSKAKQKIRPFVFLPAFILLLLTIILNFVNYEAFLAITEKAKNFMVIDMGWIFSISGVLCVIIIIFVYFSPLGEVRLGGPDAIPLLKKSSWFAVTDYSSRHPVLGYS